MQVNGVGTAGTGASPALAERNGTATAPGLGRDDFLRLLITQMRNQNPLQPIGDTEFVAQLAQFSTLDNMQKLNSSFADLLLLQGLTQGANLIGKTVSYVRAGETAVQRGTVASVTVKDGAMQLLVNGNQVSLNQVRGVETAAAGR